MEKRQAKSPPAKNGLPNVPKAAHRPKVRQKVKPEPFAILTAIIAELEAANIHFRVRHHRYDGITIEAAVPGERWEIDVLEDGDVDFERFVSAGGVSGEAEMRQAIARWAEPAAEASA